MNKYEINIFNYEAWLLDLSEGRLNADEEVALALFLEAHPELDNGLVDVFALSPPDITFDKSKLQRSFVETAHIDEDNYTDWLISATENLLNSDEKDEFSTFLSANPWAAKELADFENTRLPSKPIHYPFKKELKRKTFRPIYFRIAAAAAAILLLVVFNPFRHFLVAPKKTMATQSTPIQAASNNSEIKYIEPDENPLAKNTNPPANKPGKTNQSIGDNHMIDNGLQKEEILASLPSRKAEQVLVSSGKYVAIGLELPSLPFVAESIKKQPGTPLKKDKLSLFDKIALVFKINVHDNKEDIKQRYNAAESQLATKVQEKVSIEKQRDQNGDVLGWTVRIGGFEYNTNNNSH